MGYYTRHHLQVLDSQTMLPVDNECQLKLEEQIGKISGYSAYSLFKEETKWYDSDSNMKTLSKCHPLLLFILSGEGEESGDIWKQYWLDGKVQAESAKITINNFDSSKLK